MAARLAADVDRWTTELAGVAVSEKDQVYGQRTDLDSRGQIATPQVNYTHIGVDDLKATVLFDRLLLGSNGAAHGGAIAFLFDEVAGRLCHLAGRPTARTAYLRTNYRMVTPIDQLLDLDGRIEREEGRKRFLRLTLRQDGKVCADAEALMVALEPGQI
jgi:acyl-coenzyme A thioesterase PaaI-like protein